MFNLVYFQWRFLIYHLAFIPVGFLYRNYLSPFKVSANVRHCSGAALGLLLLFILFKWWVPDLLFLHLYASSAFLFLVDLSPTYRNMVIFKNNRLTIGVQYNAIQNVYNQLLTEVYDVIENVLYFICYTFRSTLHILLESLIAYGILKFFPPSVSHMWVSPNIWCYDIQLTTEEQYDNNIMLNCKL